MGDFYSQYPDYDGYRGSEEYYADQRRARLIAEAEIEIEIAFGETDKTEDDIPF